LNRLTEEAMTDDLHRWFVLYDFRRKHRRIVKKMPYEAVLLWYEKEPSLFIRKPTTLLTYRS
jgi:hypothetical protein